MLAVTQSAIDTVNLIAPGDAGLRIYLPESRSDDAAHALRLQVAHSPRAHDRIVEVDGARLFLEPAAAAALDEMVLDAASDGEKVRFAVAPQGKQAAEG